MLHAVVIFASIAVDPHHRFLIYVNGTSPGTLQLSFASPETQNSEAILGSTYAYRFDLSQHVFLFYSFIIADITSGLLIFCTVVLALLV